jgi:hypothetical protein
MPGSGSRVRREGSWNEACRPETGKTTPEPRERSASQPPHVPSPVVSGAEGNFAREFKDARGTIDADLKLGF